MSGLEAIVGSWYLTAGYLGIVLAMAIESCCIPLPSEIVMPLAGLYVARYPDRFSLPGVALAGTIGCLLGSAIAYGIGLSGGRPLLLRYGRFVLISQADSDRADRLFERHGDAVTFFSRLVPVIRTYISLPAGIARMRFGHFLVYTLLGSLPWCLLLAWLGLVLGTHLQVLSTVFHGLDVVVGLAIVGAVGLYVWRHLQHDQAARARHAASGQATRQPGSRRRGRPRMLPASPLSTPDRPTVPYIESVPNWPNRFAHPAAPGPTPTEPAPAADRTSHQAPDQDATELPTRPVKRANSNPERSGPVRRLRWH